MQFSLQTSIRKNEICHKLTGEWVV